MNRGYQAPRTAEELVARYRAGERRFHGTSLTDDVIEESMPGIDLSHSQLRILFNDIDLRTSRFHDADLAFTQFDANLSNADFAGAQLAWTDFGWSNLSSANLKNTNLRHSQFKSGRLDHCDFSGAVLDNTNFLDVSLVSLASSSAVVHEGPSFVDHRTVLRSLRSPALKDCLLRMGTPPIFVEYMVDCARSISEPAMLSLLQSTFISFGEPDRAFARRLHESLHTNGVRTFFFPEHAVPGKKLHRVMREGIHDYDRVILVCSRSSLQRKAVLNEIEETLQREARDGGQSYLIPIRLDDYIFSDDCGLDWNLLQAIRDRVVADFTNLENDQGKYDRSLQQLISALKKELPNPA